MARHRGELREAGRFQRAVEARRIERFLECGNPHHGCSNDAGLPPRRAYFGAETGWLETPILRRSDLSKPRTGPLIVEEYDATCVVPPGARAEVDAGGNIVIEFG